MVHFVHFEQSQDRAEILRTPVIFVSSLLPSNISRIAQIATSSTDCGDPHLHRAGQCRSLRELMSFLPSLQARYQCGLTLCQEAAVVQDAVFPEAQPFQAAATLFRTRLMRFHGQLERRQVEWELRRELRCFSSKVGARAVPRGPCAAWAA